jgi:hypothetical protein
MGLLRVEGEADALLFVFCQSFAGVPDLVAMINGFDTFFKTDDRGGADEKVTAPSGGVVRWMDV